MLPFDKLRLRFGAKPRIDARLLQQDSIRQPDHSLSRGTPLGPKNQKPDVDVGSWTFHITDHVKFTLSDCDRYTSHFPS
jgi:hypothetical protein